MGTGDIAWPIILAGVLGADAVLARSGKQTLTDSARKHWPITAAFLLVTTLHFLDWLGPVDPFHQASKLWPW